MGHDDEKVSDDGVRDEEVRDGDVRDDAVPDEEHHTMTPQLDVAAANAALPGDEHLSEREAAGTDEWARLDEGAGITNPHARSNWRVT